jgi:hypothetical protein
VRVKFLVMQPAASAVKSPLPEFWAPYENCDWSGAVLIDFDTVSCSGYSQNCVAFGACLVMVALKPFLIGAAQENREAGRRMIVQHADVVGFEESVQVDIEIWIVASELPAMQVCPARRAFDNPRGRMALHMVKGPAPKGYQDGERDFHAVIILA